MCRRIFPGIFLFSVLLFSLSAQAAQDGLYRYRYGYANFMGDGDRVYLLKNISKKTVIVDRYRRFNPGASAGWSSGLAPGKWSAIIVSLPMFTMSCTSKNAYGKYQRVCCKEALKIWSFKKFTNKNKDSGGFWIAENLPCRAMQKRVKARGFYFSFPPCS